MVRARTLDRIRQLSACLDVQRRLHKAAMVEAGVSRARADAADIHLKEAKDDRDACEGSLMGRLQAAGAVSSQELEWLRIDAARAIARHEEAEAKLRHCEGFADVAMDDVRAADGMVGLLERSVKIHRRRAAREMQRRLDEQSEFLRFARKDEK